MGVVPGASSSVLAGARGSDIAVVVGAGAVGAGARARSCREYRSARSAWVREWSASSCRMTLHSAMARSSQPVLAYISAVAWYSAMASGFLPMRWSASATFWRWAGS